MVRVQRQRGSGLRSFMLVAAATFATGGVARAVEPPAAPPMEQREPANKRADANDFRVREWLMKNPAPELRYFKDPEEFRRANEKWRAARERALEEAAKREATKGNKAPDPQPDTRDKTNAGDKTNTGDKTKTDKQPKRQPDKEEGGPPEPAQWGEPLWKVRVGYVDGQRSQIAVRGPLVVVASSGTKKGPDPLDGIHVIDGRTGTEVRLIPTSDDAYGVGLQGDVIVYGVGGKWQRVRLDGWSQPADQKYIPVALQPKAPLPATSDPRPAVVADGLISGSVPAWIYLNGSFPSRSPDGSAPPPKTASIVEDRLGRRRSIPTPERPRSEPSMGDVNRDKIWDVVIAAGEDVYAFSTGRRGNVQRAFWAGDIEASGKTPRYIDTPDSYAARLPATDESRWLMPDAEPTDSAFEAQATVPTGLPAPSRVKLKLDKGEIVSEDETTCADEHFAIDAGHLIREESAGWRLVKGAPYPVVRLHCSQNDNYLQLITASSKSYRLPPPLLWRPIAWGVAAAIACALAALAIYMRWRVKFARGPAHQDVRRQFISDAPRSALDMAHPDQARLVRGLAAFIDNDDTRPPLTVALYGKWGTGKSSIMRMLSGELNKTGRYIDIWFNAWRFQNEDRLAPALLQSIVDEIGRKSDWMTRLSALLDRLYRARARDVLLVGAAAVLALAVFVVSVRYHQIGGWLPALGAFAAGLWQKVLTPLFKVFSLEPAKLLNTEDSGKRIGFIRDFGDEFRSVIRRLPKHTRPIVYVDDLDRCSPDRVVPLLETLNMLADTGCSLFVIATDRDAVRRAVELVHRETIDLLRAEDPDEAKRYADKFLDKIVTVGVNVPEVKPSELRLETSPPETPSSLLAQVGKVLRKALRPRPGWAFFAVLLVAIGWPLWTAVRYVGEQKDPIGVIGKLLHLEDKVEAPENAGAKTTTADAAGKSQATSESSGTDASSTSDKKEPPPGKPTSGFDLSKWVATEPAPKVERASPPLTIAAHTEKQPSEERSLALTLRHLSEGIGVLALLAIAGVFWAQAEQRRRIAKAPPMAHDSEAFASALKQWTAKLPSNPRTTIRFNNAARFLYHLLHAAHAKEAGWEPSFFQILFERWSTQKEPAPTEPPSAAPQLVTPPPTWLAPEMKTWISAEHRAFKAAQSGDG